MSGLGLFFGAVTLAAAAVAAFAGDIRRSILALWLSGAAAAGMFLSVGAEVVAMIQLIVTTVTSIAAMFSAIAFGELGRADGRPWSRRVVASIGPLLVGAGFAAVIWIGARSLEPTAPGTGTEAHDIVRLGKELVVDHLLSLEMLGLLLLLSLLGAGVVTRNET